MVVFGFTVMLAVLAPFDHAYVPPGIEVVEFSVAFCPLQMVALLTVITGKGSTTMVEGVLGLTQPAGEVYTRLYVVVAAGEAVMEEVVCPPGDQTNVPPGILGVAVKVPL